MEQKQYFPLVDRGKVYKEQTLSLFMEKRIDNRKHIKLTNKEFIEYIENETHKTETYEQCLIRLTGFSE